MFGIYLSPSQRRTYGACLSGAFIGILFTLICMNFSDAPPTAYSKLIKETTNSYKNV